jgi:hypothetical protein
MSKRVSERQRWVQIFVLGKPIANVEGAAYAERKHEQLYAVADAFAKVGRVIRVEPSQHGSGLVFKARRA